MHWLWYLALGYLAFCAIGWGVVFKICPADESDERHAQEINERLAPAVDAYPIRMRFIMLLAALVMGLMFPLLLASGIWEMWSEHREWQKFRRTFRPVEFEALHPANLPAEAQQHIEQCSPILERLGFVPAVTCRLKPEPRPVLAQCLLGRDGAIQADVSWFYGTPAVVFLSVLENGHFLETGCVEESRPQDEIDAINRSGRMTVQIFAVGEGGNFADEAFLLAAYRSHLERLAELEERLGCGTLHLTAEQIPDLEHYTYAVFGQWQFDHGKVDNRPEPQPCPRGIARLGPGGPTGNSPDREVGKTAHS